MNMFKSRRKAKDSDGQDGPAIAQSAPPAHRMVKGLKRKNKNTQEEQKPVFDLATALPDSDDFRTSLLMPKLSARFSMLREQDDPNTKVGKASDDSVLFPKRVSRLNLFGHHPLADITEVESVYSTFRPPFADRERSSSFGDGYESDNGSVMSRTRPAGDGNTLFGGRQKQYKLPTSVARNFSETDTTTASRYTYESDVAQSQSPLYRAHDKEALASPVEERNSMPVTDEGDNSEVASPATAFSKHRGTQSSTNSNTGRSSTAATSVASESIAFRSSGADNVVSKSHDSVLPTPENLAAISIPKTREEAIPNRFFSQSRSVTGDRTFRPSPVYGTSLRNASSPPVVALDQPLYFGFKTESCSVSATGRHQAESPVPATSDMLADNLQPNDRGKATAMGLFNKPAREFDEHQFNQRQLQMHEGHVSTMSNGSRSASRASNEATRARQNSLQTVAEPANTSTERTPAPQVPPVPSVSASPIPESHRASKASERSVVTRPRSRSAASAAASATAVANVKARVESLIRKQNAELAAFEAEKLADMNSSENKENYIGAFFDNDDDDESDFDESSNLNSSRINSVQVDESHIHPAFRNSYRVSDIPSRKSNHSNFSRTRSVVDDEQRESSRLPLPIIETQPSEVGLSGLIRTHLRQNSDKSSIMLRPESGIILGTAEQSRATSIVSVPKTAESAPSEPFELDLNQNLKAPEIFEEPPTPTAAMSQMAQHFLSQAMAIKDAADREKAENPASDFLSKPWQDDLEPKHQRSESSETTKERREFDEKLAQRRRKIQEGLKSVAERERSRSPANAARIQPVGLHAFVQQRAATDPQPKALKVLGLQTRQGSAEDDRERHVASRNEGRGPLPEHGFNNIKQTATYARFTETTQDRQHPPRSATPPAARQGRRERANSNVAERSRSRPRRDVNPPIPHALGTFHNWNQHSPSPTEESHNPDLVLGSNQSQRNRHYPPDLQIGAAVRASPKPSPISPQSSYESPVDAARPSPAVYSNGRTTPSNGRATPNAFNRKRSVTKTMISEPTFVSSTSSVPLVHLPDAQQNHAISTPAIPMMHPRRRGNTIEDKSISSPTFSRSPLEPVPASPVIADFGSDAMGRKSPSPRKLRKATSEGGSMAAKARQQAVAADLAEERTRNPAIPVFPNRSTTAVDSRGDGAMF